jgi:lipid II:glycine glycyltransferase (peptidoglycan interpeptide bridge formation enzyme)
VTAALPGVFRVRYARPDDRPRWDAFLAARPEADVLQSWGWGEVSATVGERPLRLVLEDGSGALRGVAQALVRPAQLGRQVLYVPHGPIWEREAPDADETLTRLIRGLREAARRSKGLVVKLDPRASGSVGSPTAADGDLATRLLDRYGMRRARHDLQAVSTRVVELLGGGESLRATWTAGARKEERRAHKRGVTITLDRTGEPDAIAALDGLLQERAERRGFRARPQSFLTDLARGSATSGGWYLSLAWYEGRAIAAHAAPRVGDRAYGLYGGSLRDPELANLFGSTAAMGGLMDALGGDGAATYDLWGVVEEDDTTADPDWQRFSAYKRKFGGTPVRHAGTFDLVVDPITYRLRDWRERIRDRYGR